MKFVSLDVETANADISSICAVGVATFDNGKLVDTWSSLVNPEDEFDGMNVSIHGITAEMVADAATFREVGPAFFAKIDGGVVVTHTPFDRAAIQQTCKRWKLEAPSCRWLDSARVVRRTWPDRSARGYGLSSVCEMLGYKFQHHDALEDAKAAGHIMLEAMRLTGLDLESWLSRVEQPINSSQGSRVKRSGNEEGALFGETVVFTGSLKLKRSEAADLAAAAGCRVGADVTQETTILVVGDTNIGRLAGHTKSSKHRKAEKLIAGGASLKVVKESDFLSLIGLS